MRAAAVAVVFILSFCEVSRAATVVVAHQGYVLDGSDGPITNTSLPMSFAIYDAGSTGTQLWSGSCAVNVRAGYYAVRLGDGTCGSNLQSAYLPADGTSYLQVVVNGVDITPRLQLHPAPNAATLDGLSITALDARYPKLAGAAPAPNQVLKFIAGVWQPATDADSGGTLTSISAGTGLLGGTITTSGSLAVNVGTGAGQVAQLDANGKLASSAIPTITNAQLADASISAAKIATTGATTGQVLTFDGTAWAPGSPAAGAFTKASADPTVCNTTNEGAVYYNTALHKFAGCDGQGSWIVFGVGTGTGGGGTTGSLISTTTLSFQANDQPVVAPTGATRLKAWLWGAGGAGGSDANNPSAVAGLGGGGGAVYGELGGITAGTSFTCKVGQGGRFQSTNAGGGGGGRSEIVRTTTGVTLLVAGAGGGGGGLRDNVGHFGGFGGGLVAGGGDFVAPNTQAGGGTQSAGGVAGIDSDGTTRASPGSFKQGGHAPQVYVGLAAYPNGGKGGGSTGSYGGGGGGDGYFGGGAGASDVTGGPAGGGGGGGSNYADGTITNVTHFPGTGQTPGNPNDSRRAGAGTGGNEKASGGDGRIVIEWWTN